MKHIVRATALFAALSLSFAGAAFAQQQGKQAPPAKQAPAGKQAPAKQEPEPAGPQQIALTEKQVQGFLTVAPEMNKVTEKLQGEPDAKTQAELEAIAKKGGFANYDEYETVAANIGMVMQGMDPNTKKFGDPKAMIQAQIKEVQADKKMKAAEKKEVLAELNQALKEVQPIKNQGNIALVEKNFDQLAKLMQE
jgi:hypothetical protein